MKSLGHQIIPSNSAMSIPKITGHKRTNKTLGIRTNSKNNRWHIPSSRFCLLVFSSFLPLLQRIRDLKTTYRLLANWSTVRLLQREVLLGYWKSQLQRQTTAHILATRDFRGVTVLLQEQPGNMFFLPQPSSTFAIKEFTKTLCWKHLK